MRRAAVAAAVAALALGVAGAAAAVPGAEVGIADDGVLFTDPANAPRVAAQWRALGIDVVRIFARWSAIAPAGDSPKRPAGFRAGDPGDPRYRWGALDDAIRAVRSNGLGVMLAVTGSGPLWSSTEPGRGNPRWKPDPREFSLFAYAVAKRYRAEVDRYLIWNEPNQPGWLQPQSQCAKGRCRPAAPHWYRRLLLDAYPAIKLADPGAQVLMGQLAPVGGDGTRPGAPLRPLPFLRALGCVDDVFLPVRDGPCRGFKAPRADAVGYHPHGVLNSPDQPNPDPEEAQIADLGRIFHALDLLTDLGRLRAPGGRFDLYLTEFGYQTNPPDRAVGVSLGRQARWLQQSAYLAWRHPRIRNITQYEWRDDPVRDLGRGRRAYSGWQSGLRFSDGRPKPALLAFRNPFWIDWPAGTPIARFWGQARPGDGHTITLTRRAAGSATWKPVATAATDPAGYWTLDLPAQAGASYRFEYAPAPRREGGRPRPMRSFPMIARQAQPAASGVSPRRGALRSG